MLNKIYPYVRIREYSDCVSRSGWHIPDVYWRCGCKPVTKGGGAYRDEVFVTRDDTMLHIAPGTILHYLHQNCIVAVERNLLLLDSCGWYTNVTKSRMNKYLSMYTQDIYIMSKDFLWFLVIGKGRYPFKDGMTIKRTIK